MLSSKNVFPQLYGMVSLHKLKFLIRNVLSKRVQVCFYQRKADLIISLEDHEK